MPAVTEFAVQLENRPGTLGKICRALADRGVNIVAFEAYAGEKSSSTVRIVTDNPTATKTVLNSQQTPYSETQVVQTKLSHRAGSLATAAARLGETNINITHTYPGVEPGSNLPVVIFGVTNVAEAVKILDQIAAAAA